MKTLSERLREAAEAGRSPILGHLHVEDRQMIEAADRIDELEATLVSISVVGTLHDAQQIAHNAVTSPSGGAVDETK